LRSTGLLLAVLVPLGCGGSQKQPAQPEPGTTTATSAAPAETAGIDARMRRGHYISADGAMAFELDRRDPKLARLKYDGTDQVLDLVPRNGTFGRIDYVRKGQGVLVSVYPDGRVIAYHGNSDGISMVRDDIRVPEKCCDEGPRVRKQQPVDVKMRLGHFSSPDGTMAFVLDRRDEKLARLRYDGSKVVIELTPRQGPSGRIDYLRKGHGVLLHVHERGHVTIYHPDRPDGIDVRRDGDADPL